MQAPMKYFNRVFLQGDEGIEMLNLFDESPEKAIDVLRDYADLLEPVPCNSQPFGTSDVVQPVEIWATGGLFLVYNSKRGYIGLFETRA